MKFIFYIYEYTATCILKTRCIINILILCVYHVQVIFSIHMYLFTEVNLKSLFSDGVLVCKLKILHEFMYIPTQNQYIYIFPVFLPVITLSFDFVL